MTHFSTKIEEVLDNNPNVVIDCPDCEGYSDDDQYTCTTCWCQGGRGKLSLRSFAKLVRGDKEIC